MTGTVKIENIDRNIGAFVVRRFFGRHGDIKKITLPKRNGPPHAFVEFAERSEAKRAIRALQSTTASTIAGKFKQQLRISPEFVWQLSLVTPDDLWEEDAQDRTQVERQIVREKKRNLRYVETLGKEITLRPSEKQRKFVQHAPAEPAQARKDE